MKYTTIISKGSFLIFNIGMIYVFYTQGLSWTIAHDIAYNYGFSIFLFEFFGLFTGAMFVNIHKGSSKKELHALVPIFILFSILPFLFTIFLLKNILFFAYFLLSSGLKFFNFKSSESLQISDEKSISIVVIPALSFFLALFLTISLEISWGVLYFSLIIIFDSINEFYTWKTGRPWIRRIRYETK